MTQPTGSTRPLLGPLKNTLDMVSSTPDETIVFNTLAEWPTTDSDERVDLVFNLSLNEYVALAESIDVGRDIAFGDNSILIWFIWVRTLKAMSICDAIIACIEDPESGVSDAIVNTVLNNTSAQDISVAQGQNDLVLGLDNNPECDLDILWGGINHLVDQMDTNNIDALQILEVVTNVGEWVTDVAAGIFGVDASIIAAMLEWALYIQDNILENYEAQITTSYMDTVKCGLFCIAKENDCVLTPTDLLDYFYGRLASQLSFGSLLVESLEFIVLGVWSGSEIADAMMLSQLVFRAQLGTWFDSIAFRSIDLDMRLGYDDPSDDWELLCDCPEPTYYLELDATNSQGGVYLQTAVWNSGTGFQEIDATGVSRCYIAYVTSELWTNSFIEMRFTKIPSTTTGFRDLMTRDAPVNQSFKTITTGAETDPFETWSNSYEQGDSNKFRWRINSSPQNSNIVINRLRVTIHSTEFPQVWIDDGWEEYTP